MREMADAQNQNSFIQGGPSRFKKTSAGKPNIALSDLVGDIETRATNFINHKRCVTGGFNWQEGFGAISYSRSHLPTVIRYIQNRERHHVLNTFEQEYSSARHRHKSNNLHLLSI